MRTGKGLSKGASKGFGKDLPKGKGKEQPEQIVWERRMSTLEVIRLKDPAAYETLLARKRALCKKALAVDWYLLQGDLTDEGSVLYYKVLRILDLDEFSMRGFYLLLQSGLVGRAAANKLLWDVLSMWALDDPQEDLSNLVTHEVNVGRRVFDIPIQSLMESSGWSWDRMRNSDKDREAFRPEVVPSRGEHWERRMDLGNNVPLPPPACFGRLPQDPQGQP